MFKKKYLLFFSLFLLGVLLFTSCLPRPLVTEGILKGRVMVPEGPAQAKQLTGQALVNAIVNIIDPLTGDIIATTTTDANGYYLVFVLAGGPYILQAVKEGMKVQQVTPLVEVGEEYDLGTADCTTTAVALIAQAMLEDDSYPDDPADINLADIEANPDFGDVLNSVCGVLGAGEDPAVSALVQQAIEDFLYPPTPTPTPTPTPLSSDKAITAFSFTDPAATGTVDEANKTIALTVPFGTAVTALVATFTNSAASAVTVGGTAQTSGTTANNFTSPVAYLVTAQDGTTVTYIVTVTVALSSDATISAGTLAGVALAGDFAGGANIGASSALTVTVPDASKTLAALALTKGNANSTIKYVKSASAPADDTAYTETYTAGATTITVANGDVIWLLVTAENTTTKKYYKITVTVSAPLLVVGQSYGGGIVAYIDGTGVHGLIAATADQSTGMAWSNIRTTLVGTTETAIGTGQANTTAIVGQTVGVVTCTSGAAYLCYHLEEGGYSDWYLPSKDELNKLYLNKVTIGGFANAAYWSSSETSATNAWNQNFNNGNQNNNNKNNSRRVRAVRDF